jgi:hypothetical protein
MVAPLIALALVVVALGACLLPLIEPGRPRLSVDYVPEREAERERLLAAIRDADLDLAMGKISAGDHAAMRASLETQAVSVLAALDRERSDRDGVPRDADATPPDGSAA